MIEFKNNLINGTFTLDEALKFANSERMDSLVGLSYAETINDKEHIEEYESMVSIWKSELDLLDRVKEISGTLRFKSRTEYIGELSDRLEKCDSEEIKLDIKSIIHSVKEEKYQDKEYINFTTLDDEYKFS